MEYNQISKEQQIQILKGRIAGWEADHFGHEINLRALRANGADTESTLSALSTLQASIESGKTHLAELENDSTPES